MSLLPVSIDQVATILNIEFRFDPFHDYRNCGDRIEYLGLSDSEMAHLKKRLGEGWTIKVTRRVNDFVRVNITKALLDS